VTTADIALYPGLFVELFGHIVPYSPTHQVELTLELTAQLTGTSFTQYLKNYRLELASEKLNDEERKISEIAFECGFNNLSYFTRAISDIFRS
jgi:methylphosphotriester-DNA--protein-cysteine methyltransferase